MSKIIRQWDRVSLRVMSKSDCETMEAIEFAVCCGPLPGGRFPLLDKRVARWWTAEDYRQYLPRRGCWGMVAEIGGEVAGGLLYRVHPAECLLLERLAVAPRCWGRGVGRALVGRLDGETAVYAAVGESNLPMTGSP